VIAVGVISDRGDLYLPGCIDSLKACGLTVTWVIDDSRHSLGMAGAAAASWQRALENPSVTHLLHIEEDFRIQDLPIDMMRRVLDRSPHLAQVVLKRHPWSDEERQAGGQIEVAPHDYTDCGADDLHWVEHDRLFSMNPSLIPRRTLELGVPVGHPGGVEAGLTERCREAGMRFAYYGRRSDPPRCEHVGFERAPVGWSW
jgi:hypothetical protein